MCSELRNATESAAVTPRDGQQNLVRGLSPLVFASAYVVVVCRRTADDRRSSKTRAGGFENSCTPARTRHYVIYVIGSGHIQ